LAAEHPFRIGLPRRPFLADSTDAGCQMLQDRERLAREAVRKRKEKAAWLFTKEGSQFFYAAHMELASIEALVMLAREGDKNAVEILRDRARDAARTGVSVPTDLHEFVWEWFIDGPPKAKSGSGPKDIGLYHLTVALLVDMVSRDYGFPEYRNTEHRGQKTGPMSACLLVAEELGLSERRVEEIWAEHKEMIRRRRHQSAIIPPAN
jgi:hypothetical protein